MGETEAPQKTTLLRTSIENEESNNPSRQKLLDTDCPKRLSEIVTVGTNEIPRKSYRVSETTEKPSTHNNILVDKTLWFSSSRSVRIRVCNHGTRRNSPWKNNATNMPQPYHNRKLTTVRNDEKKQTHNTTRRSDRKSAFQRGPSSSPSWNFAVLHAILLRKQ
jgi:hypothetical protein